MKILNLFFGNWSHWVDVGCTESCGYHTLIQMKKNYSNGKKKFRKVKIWVNDISKADEINNNIINKL